MAAVLDLGGRQLAPINWVLGALGIILGLSLVETLLVLVIGNLVGCALFGVFCLMGHRTGVNQMVLSRAAFGRRGAYLPATIQLLMTMGWLGVNTWIVLDLVLGIFEEMGFENPGTATKYAVGIGIMVVQAVIAIVGFYWIQAFEKWTVPIAAGIMVLMSILAWSKVDINWTTSTVSGGDKLTSVTQLMTAIGIGWGITHGCRGRLTTRGSSSRTRLSGRSSCRRSSGSSCRRCGSGSWARRSPAPARKPIQPRW